MRQTRSKHSEMEKSVPVKLEESVENEVKIETRSNRRIDNRIMVKEEAIESDHQNLFGRLNEEEIG